MVVVSHLFFFSGLMLRGGCDLYRSHPSLFVSIPIEISILFGNSEHPFPERKNMPFRSRVQPFI